MKYIILIAILISMTGCTVLSFAGKDLKTKDWWFKWEDVEVKGADEEAE